MGRKPNTERNKLIIQLRDKEGKTFSEIGKMLRLDRKTAWDIWSRDKNKYTV